MITLVRVCYHSLATMGVLINQDNTPLCLTLENPARANAKNISCIPEGQYNCESFSSQKHPNVWQVLSVPNRTGILIHTGNTSEDTEGCILVGQSFSALLGRKSHQKRPAIISSDITLNFLRATLPASFPLSIVSKPVIAPDTDLT